MPIQKPTAKTILSGFDYAKAEKSTVASTWHDIMYFTNPRKRDILSERTEGEKLPTDVYDDTAIQSNLVLAAGLSGYMTNSAQRWFEVKAKDEKLMEDGQVRRFFADATDIMYAAIGESNFYQQVHEMYLDLGALGIGFLYEEEDSKDDIRFYARHPKEIYILEDHREEVNIVYRAFKMTAWQSYTFFGKDKVSDAVKKSLDKQDYGKEFSYVQYVAPRFERDVSKDDTLNMPFASFWVCETSKKICKESGYREFPYFTPRFYKNTNEAYGYGPGISSYSDIRMINQMMEYYIKGAETSLWPAWMLEHDSMIGSLDLRAGALNYQRAPLTQGMQAQQLTTDNKYQIGLDFIDRTERKISSAFFADLFLMLTQKPNMTATEVIERSQEKMLILGPVLGRLQNELLNPLINRTFNILARRGKLPTPPEQLMEAEYEVVYVSPLAKAQRAIQARDMTTFLSLVGQMAELGPSILDNIDGDVVIEKLSRIYSVDPDIIRDSKERDAMRKARDEQQSKANAVAMAEQIANTASSGAQAKETDARTRQIEAGATR